LGLRNGHIINLSKKLKLKYATQIKVCNTMISSKR
jgi:hypothetical protein